MESHLTGLSRHRLSSTTVETTAKLKSLDSVLRGRRADTFSASSSEFRGLLKELSSVQRQIVLLKEAEAFLNQQQLPLALQILKELAIFPESSDEKSIKKLIEKELADRFEKTRTLQASILKQRVISENKEALLSEPGEVVQIVKADILKFFEIHKLQAVDLEYLLG